MKNDYFTHLELILGGTSNRNYAVFVKYDNYSSINYSFAAVQVWIDQQNYTVTEGGAVNITLVTNTDNYGFDFNVTLLPLVDYYWPWNWYWYWPWNWYWYRLAIGESC